ncbi:hypothetical protein CVT24_010516 [Panaeolus cyanescens]|uniref:Uncharacterized protein n=1 Tax=Panaeolus cyanescens TaxID=181874 RepID=A0A409WDN1_9AGAR|nr:hypothetical protein CVT24_010516 [Panaeolus cyanescens]
MAKKKKKASAKKSRSKWSPARLEFLMSQKSGFHEAFKKKDTKNWFANCYRRFIMRFPPTLADNEDPPKDVLDAVDDAAADEYELKVPDERSLSKEEYDESMKKYNEEKGRLKSDCHYVSPRRSCQQLQRWFYNQHAKDAASETTNFFEMIFDNALGIGDTKPRHSSALNIWRKDSKVKEEIEELAQAAFAEDESKALVSVREEVARRLFESRVPAETRELMQARADEDHEKALAAWATKRKERTISTAPEDRQKCIDALASVVQPLLDAICDATGWTVSLIAGGPEPADGGKLHLQMIHSGTTSGAEPMDFGRAEHVRIPALLYPMFWDFLHRVYPTDVCKSRALPSVLSDSDAREEDGTIPEPAAAGPSNTTLSSRDRSLSTTSRTSTSYNTPSMTTVPLSPVPSISDLRNTMDTSSPEPESPAIAFNTHDESPVSVPDAQSTVTPDAPDASHATGPGGAASHGTAQNVVSGAPRGSKRGRALDEGEALSGDVSHRKKQARVGKLSKKKARDTSAVTVPARAASIPPPPPPSHAAPVSPPPPPSLPSQRDITPTPSTDLSSLRLTATNGNSSWLTDCLTMFVTGSDSLGEQWSECLTAYRSFQEKHGYGVERRLPTNNRPALVAKWVGMGRTRTPKWRPQELVPTKFNEEFKLWWAGLQPEWRVENGVVINGKVDGNWMELFYPGKNGLLSVIACLYYWGLACQSAADKKAWLSAISDCTVAFRALEALNTIN